MGTVFFYLNEEDSLIYPAKYQVFLTKKQLQDIIYACEMTLCYYDANFLNDDDIAAKNEKYLDDEYYKFFNTKRVVQKTNVYLMLDENTGYYKIGRSINPTQRERTLQSEKASIKLIASYPATTNDELILHKKFEKLRVRGEWFDLSDENIVEIKEYFKNN